MSLSILSVAYPMTVVGPTASGGSEHVLSLLDRQLTKKGHRSIVIAVEGSEVHGELVPSPKATTSELNDEVRRWGQRAHQRLILETLNRYPIDLVHMHSLDFHTYLPVSDIPILATLHLPIDWYPKQIFHHQRKNLALNCVSQSQQLCCPDDAVNVPVVRNGIDVQSFNWKAKKQPFVLGLGRVCPEKGFHLALAAARQAGVPMILAGELFPYRAHVEYFQQKIAPLLDSDRQFIGPVNAQEKRHLLATAEALLVPSLVAETCSLVTMEALASGTPVIAFRVGAIPELIEEGKTGFLVEGCDQMAASIKKATALRAKDCRAAAEDRCDFRAMEKNYMTMYKDLLALDKDRKTSRVPAELSWLAS